ncbi:hypothetical protein DVR12_26945 [Chitinophaga silvatica]|uniref:Lipoprotein n=1 Tax=Chitinophaga silvatica TaxID=2282649 RepID=A0A3E1Y1X3_9BACT|nr:hypothetical protein [Chitinophaga silvatica]RFS18685.1 hypothetical protein DVR12_26945 [Chitinophaga silvatica]
MNRVKCIGVIAFVVFILFGCESSQKDIFDVLKDSILDSKIEQVRINLVLNEKYNLKDTVIEDEGVEWKAVLLKERGNNRLLAILETNWENQTVISRITIVDESIGKGNYRVGSQFKEVKDSIDSTNLNNSPDGVLALTSKRDKRINILLDLPETSPLTEGVSSLNEIPDKLQIKEIVFLKLDN